MLQTGKIVEGYDLNSRLIIFFFFSFFFFNEIKMGCCGYVQWGQIQEEEVKNW